MIFRNILEDAFAAFQKEQAEGEGVTEEESAAEEEAEDEEIN